MSSRLFAGLYRRADPWRYASSGAEAVRHDAIVAACAPLAAQHLREVVALVRRLAHALDPGGHLVLVHPRERAARLHASAHHHELFVPVDERHLDHRGAGLDLTISTFARVGVGIVRRPGPSGSVRAGT